MKKWIPIISIALMCISSSVYGGGISVDAGLTPAKDRWILRSQMRFMQSTGDVDNKMNMYHFPLVVAYGLRSDVTLMIRQAVVRQTMKMAHSKGSNSGFGDLFVLGKYKLYRRNTPSHTFGTSATLGFEVPTGNDDFTSKTWDVTGGMYCSYRRESWALDGSIAYAWNGLMKSDETTVKPGNELSLDGAIAYQIGMAKNANTAFAPVLELSYKHCDSDKINGASVMNTGESIFLVAPGVKFTLSSMIYEGLLWVPVWQEQNGTQMEMDMGFLIGTRFMF